MVVNHPLVPTVETNGVETYYEAYGDGPPVLFLHGAFGDHRAWAELARPLADDYRVVVYDLRGHGRTGGADEDTYNVRLYAEDLRSLVAALGLERPAICGFSMGGMVVQRYAATYPDAVAALATLGAETPEILSAGEWIERRLVPAVVDAGLLSRERAMAVVEWVNHRRYDDEAAGDLEALEDLQRRHAEDYPEIAGADAEKLHRGLREYTRDPVDHASITAPALVLYGELEIPTIARHAAYLAEAIPDARVREIPEAGHQSHVDNPGFVRRALREFLADVRPEPC